MGALIIGKNVASIDARDATRRRIWTTRSKAPSAAAKKPRRPTKYATLATEPAPADAAARRVVVLARAHAPFESRSRRRDDDPQGEDDGGQVSPLWTAAPTEKAYNRNTGASRAAWERCTEGIPTILWMLLRRCLVYDGVTKPIVRIGRPEVLVQAGRESASV